MPSLDHVIALEKTARNDAISGGAFHRRFDDRRPGMVLWESLVRRLNSLAGPTWPAAALAKEEGQIPKIGIRVKIGLNIA